MIHGIFGLLITLVAYLVEVPCLLDKYTFPNVPSPNFIVKVKSLINIFILIYFI
jgi:hypothetical protein